MIRSKVKLGVKILVTVKADAYGHGLVPVAKKLSTLGVDYFGVASIDEGIKLRQQGIKNPILILGLILKEDLQPLFTYDLTPTIADLKLAQILNSKAAKLKQVKAVQIKVDTGMGRVGVLFKDAEKLVRQIWRFKNLKIEGIFTHFALADLNRKFTLGQINVFQELVCNLKKAGINISLVHAANSIGLLDFKNSHFTMIRPGLIVYGLYPKKNLKLKLKPVLSLKTRIVFIKQVPAGYGLSYGHIYKTTRRTHIVTLPIGYGDGYPRNLSNQGWVLIGGKRFRICGRICMDQIMVDVGNFKPKVGSQVVLIGSQGRKKVTTEELALLSQTIPYEIVCGLGSRIPRVYLS